MNKGKKKIISIISVLIVLLAIVATLFIIIKNKEVDNSIGKGENLITAKQKIEENGWSYDIISNITTDNVPIPDQYNYVSGDKESGAIIEDTNGCYYLWIPYEENIEVDTSEFFQNIESTYEIDADTMDSIIKYGGFYVALNMNIELDDLKSIESEDYENYAMQLNVEMADSTTNTHMLYKEEIEQIVNFMNKNNFYIAQNTIGIEANTIENFARVQTKMYQKVEVITAEELDELVNEEETDRVDNIQDEIKDIIDDINNEENEDIQESEGELENIEQIEDDIETLTEEIEVQDYIYRLKTTEYPDGVPIPSGYRYNVTEKGIVSIQDEANENLVYIWVPLNEKDLENKKEELKTMYENYVNSDGEKLKTEEGSEIYKVFNETAETLPEEFKESIKQYGGFYVSEAELGYDSSGNYYNRARGMVESTVTKTVAGGDYFRGSTYEGFTIDKVKEIAEKVTEDNYAVESHLMYGVEYDAMLLWIKNTNQDFQDEKGRNIDTVLLENSTSVGKYSNSNLNATSTATRSSVYFNGIWGLGGNLAEVTQEASGDLYVTRGGAYNVTGEEEPIASRNITDVISSEKVGFRTCLYIATDLPEVTESLEEYDTTVEDDTIVYIGDFEFNQADWNDVPRWVSTWDGMTVYEEPNIESKVINTLGFASEVLVTAKATNESETKDADGRNLHWARIKLSNGMLGFINANKLTDTTTTIGNYKFVIKRDVTRYHSKAIDVYKNPDSTGEKIKTIEYAGALTVIGKSTNAEWAIVEVDGQQGYVYSRKLAVTAGVETINGIKFVTGDSEIRIVKNENGAKGYKNPGAEEIAEIAIPHKSTVTINAISEDETIARVVFEGNTYFVSSEDLQYPGPTLNVELDNETGKVTIKAYDIGRGVKDIYSNTDVLEKQEKKDDDGKTYYEASFTAERSGNYNIKAQDNEGNWTYYDDLDTSKIEKDESNTPITPTPTPDPTPDSGDTVPEEDDGVENTDVKKPQITNAYATGKVIVVYSSSDTQYICYKKTTDSTWKWCTRTEVTTIYVGDNKGTYYILAGKYVDNKAVYSEQKTVTVDGQQEDPTDQSAPLVHTALSTNNWTNQNVYIYIYARSTTGISSIKVNGYNASWQWSESKQMYVGKYTATQYGKYTIEVTGKNGVTTTVESLTVQIDKVAPYYSTGEVMYGDWYAIYEDDLSGFYDLDVCRGVRSSAWTRGHKYCYMWYGSEYKGCSFRIGLEDCAGNTRVYEFIANW